MRELVENERDMVEILFNRDLCQHFSSYLTLRDVFNILILNREVHQLVDHNKEVWKHQWKYYHDVKQRCENRVAYFGNRLEEKTKYAHALCNIDWCFVNLLKTISLPTKSVESTFAEQICAIWYYETKSHNPPTFDQLFHWFQHLASGQTELNRQQIDILCAMPTPDNFQDSEYSEEIKLIAECFCVLRQRVNAMTRKVAFREVDFETVATRELSKDTEHIILEYRMAVKVIPFIEKKIYRPSKMGWRL